MIGAEVEAAMTEAVRTVMLDLPAIYATQSLVDNDIGSIRWLRCRY